MLSLDTYKSGFLVDEEWIGGVADHPEKPGFYLVFILNHQTGEKVGSTEFATFAAAVSMLNAFPRAWIFEKTKGGCGGGGGGGSCGGGGKCGGKGSCHSSGADHGHDHDHDEEHDHDDKSGG